MNTSPLFCVEPKSYVEPESVIIDELNSPCIIMLSVLTSPRKILPPKVISPVNSIEPVFTPNLESVIFEVPVPTCRTSLSVL